MISPVNFSDGDAETRRLSLTTVDEDPRDDQLVKRFPGSVQEVGELELSPPAGLSTLPRGTGREPRRTGRGTPAPETRGERTYTTTTVTKVRDKNSTIKQKSINKEAFQAKANRPLANRSNKQTDTQKCKHYLPAN